MVRLCPNAIVSSRPRGGSHVGRTRPPRLIQQGSLNPLLTPAQAARHRRGRRCRARTAPVLPGRCGARRSVGVRRLPPPAPSRSARTTRTRCRRRRCANVIEATSPKKTGIAVKINTVDHNTFQEQINSYLQGKPGRRLHVVRRLPDAVLRRRRASRRRSTTSGRRSRRRCRRPSRPPRRASTGTSTSCRSTTTPGRSSTGRASSKENGYTVPKTWDQFIALAKKMQADGLTPIAFTDKDGWPAMGTFDILNMRINGYAVPRRPDGREAVVGQPAGEGRLQPVDASSCPTTPQGALGLTWQEGAQQLVNKQAGMFLLGSFVGQQFTKPADHADLDFFPFPAINPKWGQDSIDAPIDGFMLSKKPKNLDGAKTAARRTSAAPPARTPTSRSTRTTSAPTSARTRRAYYAAAEEGGEADRRRRSTSRSTWTATRGRTSPPR